MSDSSVPVLSREEWQAKIQAAEGYPQIFELANQALAAREAWGDDLRGSQAAARKWAGFFFPVAAIESGAVLPGARVPRETLLAMGREAAKDVAIALLAPLPAQAPDGGPQSEEVLAAQWSAASAAAEFAAKIALTDAPGCGRLLPHYIFGYESMHANAKIEWEEAAHKKSWDEVADKLSKPWEKAIKKDCSQSGQAALAAQWESASGEPGQLAGVLADSGASFVLAGPAGGMAAICKGASVLRESYRDLARLSGLPPEAVGMGLEGIGLNMAGRGHVAYHNPGLNLMAFGHVPTDLGHEWTHLLDERVSKAGTAKQKAALHNLKKAPLRAEPDPELVAQRRDPILKEQRINLGYYLMEKAKDDLARDHLVPGDYPNEDPLCDDAFMDKAREALAKGDDGWLAFLAQCQDPKKPAVSEGGAKSVGHALKEGFGLNEQGVKVCDFVREAQIRDARGYAKPGYFCSEKEMIARIAESAFFAKGSIPSLAWENPKDYRVNPRGREAEVFSQFYAKLMDACAAAPDVLMGKRAKAAQSRRAEAQPEPLAASLSFDAWRAKRESLAEPSEPAPTPSTKTVAGAGARGGVL